MDKLYTISEVADKLNLAPKTLRRWEEAGKFKATRTVGGQRRYGIEDLQVLDAIKHETISSSDDLLNIEQAANLFGVTPQTVKRWEDEGKIHPFITAGNTYYPRSKLIGKIQELKSKYNQEQEEKEKELEKVAEYKQVASKEPDPEPQVEKKQEKIKPRETVPQDNKHSIEANKEKEEKPKVRGLTKMSDQASNQTKLILTTLLINTLLTLLLIAGYHSLTSSEIKSPEGEVQGTAAEQSPVIRTLSSILDVGGNLETPGKIETRDSISVGRFITLSPATPPSPTPGTLYYDAGTQTIKVFTRGAWHDFPSARTLELSENTLVKSGQSTMQKGTQQAAVTDPEVTDLSHITATFTSDYSPARKYWVTQSPGSFTIHTDFPVGSNAQFTYLILNPKEEATGSAQTQ